MLGCLETVRWDTSMFRVNTNTTNALERPADPG